MAYHFNWRHDEVLAMPHWERQRWCEEISAINERMNQGGGAPAPGPSGIPAGPTGGQGAPGGQGGAGGQAESGAAPSLEQDIPDEFWEEEQESFLDTDEEEPEETEESEES